jgi:hypothetical protein
MCASLCWQVERLRNMVETGDLHDDTDDFDGGGLAPFPPNGLGFHDAPSHLSTGVCVPTG